MITLVISLDTELAWGRLGVQKEAELLADESAGRDAIKYVLKVFDEYQISATWGIVGHLLLEECDTDTHYTASYIDAVDPRTDRETDPLYYAPEILDWIQGASTDHEIAGHSFTHPRFTNINRSQARTELDTMVSTFADEGVSIDSLIHPGIDLAHLDLLPEFGIKYYCGASKTSNYTLKQGLLKLLRQNPDLVGAPTIEPTEDEHGTLRIPRSRSLRDQRWGWLNPRRIRHTLQNSDDGVLHLTFHPHNIIYDTFLRRTLPKVARLVAHARAEGRLEIKTFRELKLPSGFISDSQ